MFAKYIGGIIGLTKDVLRFTFFLLKRPHYVAVLLAAVIGVFYINGIPPHEIAAVVKGKWDAFIENRKEVFGEDVRLLSSYLNKRAGLPEKVQKEQLASQMPDVFQEEKKAQEQQILKQRILKQQLEQEKWMREETFGWQAAFDAVEKEEPISENAVQGILSVVSADKIKIGKQTFLLKVRLMPGKAAEAYQQIKRRFDGHEARCVPDEKTPERAECYVQSLGVSETLIDFGLAEPF